MQALVHPRLSEAPGTSTSPFRRSLSVVIPAYNEEVRLPRTLREIHAFLSERGYDAEILVVDDGSRDGTAAAARELGRTLPMIRVLSYGRNRGKGFAVRTGMLAATKEAALFCDADHSTPIGDIDGLWRAFDRGADTVIASRHLAGSDIRLRQPLYRRVMGRAFNLIVSLFGIRGIRDTQCGFKLFRTSLARRIFAATRTDGFAFDVEALMRARQEGSRIVEVPVRWVNAPDSRVRAVRDSWRMLLEILRMRGLL